MITRRRFLQLGAVAGLSAAVPWSRLMRIAYGMPAATGLSDPALQPKFVELAPNALDPSFRFMPPNGLNNKFKVNIRQATQFTGLVDSFGNKLPTPVFGYGANPRGFQWPGATFEVQRDVPIEVLWDNQLHGSSHLLPVDTSIHWCYSLHGDNSANGVDYTQFSIEKDGVPIVTHLHGGHTRSPFDGNPEYFFSPGWKVRGPRWVDKKYIYDNDQSAGNLWYHDHALGITRLNVYAGLAGFYFIRDEFDTGKPDNPLGLPAYPYELAYAIQDRMFRNTGELFYSAFPGDPAWADFITGEGLADDEVPRPSILAEFFGDHMLVNGVIWPKAQVEPRHYRMRLLNGSDSRFLAIRFRPTGLDATTLADAGDPLPFWIIGSDQGLTTAATEVDTLLIGPGERYDVVFDFSQVPMETRVIMENVGGDAPFGGDLFVNLSDQQIAAAVKAGDLFPDRQTDRIMAFDVVLPFNMSVVDRFDPRAIGHYGGNMEPVARTRKVGLFEGTDEFGRLQPLLGAETSPVGAETSPDVVESLVWAEGVDPITEMPELDTTEIWEIYNTTGDAHPIHLHLVNFEILDRQRFKADLIEKEQEQHNGQFGTGFKLKNIQKIGRIEPAKGVERAPKDMVTALPGQVTRIKATFDRPGRYVWHCHILSHEDHEMMRAYHVTESPPNT